MAEVSKIKKIYFNNVIKNLCKRADIIFTVSEYSKLQISNWLNRNDIVVSSNGVSSEFLNYHNEESFNENRYFLYVGNRRKHKNFDGLLQAFSLFANEFDKSEEFQLHVTGDPSMECISRLSVLNIKDKVKFLGSNLSDYDLAGKYKKAVALIIPSYYEGFGMPALEAMAIGTPVIASNCTSLPEVLDGAGILIDPNDVVTISDAMTAIVSDSKLQADCRAAGLRRAKFYSWDKSAKIVNTNLNNI